MLMQLHSMSESEKIQKSNRIFLSLQKLMKGFSGSGAWGAFQSLPTEPQIEFQTIKNIDWCYPKTENQKLSFWSGTQNFSISQLKTLEPTDGIKKDIDHLTGICVPVVALNTEGYRLGRGKGFYDQTFQNFLGTKIGLCFDFCLSKETPFESHDLKMDYIITDLQVIPTAGEK
jgi:5-formyltetrahydrofolate cyclo-ligase